MVFYTFQHMSIITKLSQDVTQYCKNITSPDRRKCENTKRYTSMNSTNGTHELQKENLRDQQGAGKDEASDGLLMIHASTAPL